MSDEDRSVELAVTGDGLIVQGSTTAVTRLVDRLKAAVGEHGTLRHVAADGLAVASSVGTLGTTYGEYVKLSPRAMELLRRPEVALVPSGDGFFYGFVRDAERIVGQVDFELVDHAAERVLGLQTAAIGLALRTAVRDVARSLERVEGKVDHLLELVRAERLGNVSADRQTLESLVTTIRSRGDVSETDWDSVAPLGATIVRDIEALRTYVVRQAEIPESRGRRRSAALEALADDLIGESLALLVGAEHNLTLWEEIKLAREATLENELMPVLVETRARFEALNAADQAMINDLSSTAGSLMAPTGWEGLRPFERRSLVRAGRAVTNSVASFATQRSLDLGLAPVEYPSTGESLEKALDRVRNLWRSRDQGLGRSPST